MQATGATAISARKAFWMLFGLAGVSASMTVLYLGMRSVMDVGGFCAEGGPYEIAVHCPQGIAYLMPGSIFAGLAAAALYAFNRIAGGPNIIVLLWSILFGSLGWNFLEYGFLGPDRDAVIAWVVCGVIFEVMAIVPLWMIGMKTVIGAFIGMPDPYGHRQPLWFAALHTLVLAGGIWGGYSLFLRATGQPG